MDADRSITIRSRSRAMALTASGIHKIVPGFERTIHQDRKQDSTTVRMDVSCSVFMASSNNGFHGIGAAEYGRSVCMPPRILGVLLFFLQDPSFTHVAAELAGLIREHGCTMISDSTKSRSLLTQSPLSVGEPSTRSVRQGALDGVMSGSERGSLMDIFRQFVSGITEEVELFVIRRVRI